MEEVVLTRLLELLLQYLQKSQKFFTLPHGKRSVIRYIGSRLPMRPVRRVRFEYVRAANGQSSRKVSFQPCSSQSHDLEETGGSFVVTLADIPWLEISSPEKSWRQRSETRQERKPRRKTMYVKPFITKDSRRRESSFPSLDESLEGLTSSPSYRDPEAKINELEDELARLRQQIAAIVSTQSNTVGRPLPMPPLCTSPPVGSPCPPSAPPPPPPPPPLMQGKKFRSVVDIIRENKAKNGKEVAAGKPVGVSGPDMTEVLKGLGTVKLKKIARSPGGTPFRQAPKLADSDPAAIIARALKKKFSRVQTSSPDKENQSRFTPSPKRGWSPLKQSPLAFGPHLLRPAKKKKRLSTPKKAPLQTINV